MHLFLLLYYTRFYSGVCLPPSGTVLVYFSFNISKTNHSQNLNLYYVVSAHAYRTNRLQTTPAFVSNISVQSR